MASDDIVFGDHFVWFGDGMTALIISKTEEIDDDGGKMMRLIMRPSRAIISLYGLKGGEDVDPNTGYSVQSYPAANVHSLIESTNMTRIIITTNFKGNPTRLSRRDEYYTEQIKDQERLIRTLHANNARLHEEMRKAMVQQKQYAKETADLVKEYRRAGGRTEEEVDDLGPPTE